MSTQNKIHPIFSAKNSLPREGETGISPLYSIGRLFLIVSGKEKSTFECKGLRTSERSTTASKKTSDK